MTYVFGEILIWLLLAALLGLLIGWLLWRWKADKLPYTRWNKMSGELDGANAKVNALTGDLDGANGTIGDLRMDLDGANGTIGNLRGELDGANGRIGTLTGELDGVRAEFDLSLIHI